ncbi:expressed unknown protein [Seminavis robusta]|uniref:Uncharacterized protein n=1 Tax=Seminavis robusta TaxID=568900 RepID=A0A9N8H7T9_9STRA|nr:expressed unknown protein [Seminavis robusta]|eukprot:Sro192_g082523.1  (100) ;mRNA; f:59700-59999
MALDSLNLGNNSRSSLFLPSLHETITDLDGFGCDWGILALQIDQVLASDFQWFLATCGVDLEEFRFSGGIVVGKGIDWLESVLGCQDHVSDLEVCHLGG